VAELQNIVYNEYLPNLLNKETLRKHHLMLELESEYFPRINPTTRNEFATAAFRFGHSQVQVFKAALHY